VTEPVALVAVETPPDEDEGAEGLEDEVEAEADIISGQTWKEMGEEKEKELCTEVENQNWTYQKRYNLEIISGVQG